ncbi:MAG: hypothetical protein HYV28_13260 [Ignavibacteriales bacterium]|nr:hypothetical protein [Ignavibacteriales bacterium]
MIYWLGMDETVSFYQLMIVIIHKYIKCPFNLSPGTSEGWEELKLNPRIYLDKKFVQDWK